MAGFQAAKKLFLAAAVLCATISARPSLAADLFSGPEEDLRNAISRAIGCKWIGDLTEVDQICRFDHERGWADVEFQTSSPRSITLTFLNLTSWRDAKSLNRARTKARKLVKILFPEWKKSDAWMDLTLKRCVEPGCQTLTRLGDVWMTVDWSSTNAEGARGATMVVITEDVGRFVNEDGMRESFD